MEAKVFYDLTIGIVTFLVGVGLTWLYHMTKNSYNINRRKRFWIGKDATLNIIYGVRRGTIDVDKEIEAADIDVLNIVNVNDVKAIAYASAHLHAITDITINTTEEFPSRQGNLFLIGGPIANSITKEIVDEVRPHFDFRILDEKNREVYNIEGTYDISTKFNDRGEIVRDVGWFYRSANPFDINNIVVIAAGCFGYATESIVRFLSSPEFIKMINREQLTHLEGVIEVIVQNGRIIRWHPIQIFSYDTKYYVRDSYSIGSIGKKD